MWNRRHRWIRRFAAGLAFAALAVPTAQAKIVEDSGIAAESPQVVADFKGYGYYQGTPAPASDQSGIYRQSPGVPASEQAPARPDDRSVRFTPEAGNPEVVVVSTGFDWSDAGIGAGIAVGLMLLALGAAVATRHTGQKGLAGT
ncbi:MAG TPA: hypothetical protein VHK22_08130 [Gaiellaceae bacterium]|jgi:hypothetical protein|nr:hypothetical protein [Gaiellaceae bacterium]